MLDLIHALFSRAAIGKSDWPGREFSTFVPSLAWVEGPSWRDGEQDPCVSVDKSPRVDRRPAIPRSATSLAWP